MASERLSKALMSVGDGLVDMAGLSAQKEREQAQYMREQSLIRLRGEQRSSESAADREFRAAEAAKDREFRGEQTDKTIAAADRRTKDSEDYQMRRLRQQQLDSVESANVANIAALDKEISSAQRILDEAAVDSMGADAEGVAQIRSRLDQLRDQRRMSVFKNMVQLKELEDDRYKDKDMRDLLISAGYSEAEADAFVKDAEMSKPMPHDKHPLFAPSQPTAASPAPTAAPMPSATPAQSRELMSSEPAFGTRRNEPGDPAGPDFGAGGRQIMDIMNTKPWIRNEAWRERMGLQPLEERSLMTSG